MDQCDDKSETVDKQADDTGDGAGEQDADGAGEQAADGAGEQADYGPGENIEDTRPPVGVFGQSTAPAAGSGSGSQGTQSARGGSDQSTSAAP